MKGGEKKKGWEDGERRKKRDTYLYLLTQREGNYLKFLQSFTKITHTKLYYQAIHIKLSKKGYRIDSVYIGL